MKNVTELKGLAKAYIDEKLTGNDGVTNFNYPFKKLNHENFHVVILSRVTKLAKRLMDKMIKDADHDDTELMWSCMGPNDTKQDVAEILYKAAYKEIIALCKGVVFDMVGRHKKGYYREVA